MAELLGSAGYKTTGFVATNSHFKAGNMDQGFNLLDEPVIKRPKRRRAMLHNESLEADPGTPKTRKPLYRQADATVDLVIDWLDSVNQEDKFFLWLHFFDPHRPYGSPQKYVEEIRKQTDTEGRSFADYLINEHHINFDKFIEEPTKILPIIDRYDAEILFTDNEIKRLYQHLGDRGLNSNTLWIITSDHGEGLGGHKAISHGRHVYNEQIHIPLVFHFTSGGVKEIVVEQAVEQVDILPTLAQLIGTDLSGQTKPVEGASLLPLMLKDYGHYPSKYAFSHKWAVDRERLPEFMKKRYEARAAFREKLAEEMRKNGKEKMWPNRIPRTEDEKKSFKEEKFALQDKEYKYIFNTLRKDELYNLLHDPYEVRNLIGMGLKEEIIFSEALMLKVKLLKEGAGGEPESVDRETIERLKSLGYMQ
jgi:arylsulfatase A-like enzyme